MTLPQDLSSRFQVLSEIGSGPTGKSVHAQDRQTGRTGLLKVIETGAGVPAAERQRIKRELTKQTKIANPRLAIVYECSTGEPLWLFREHIEGETLKQRLERGPLPLTVALTITAQIAAALDELHRAGLLHRDLKPSHIILRPSAEGGDDVVVIDAGVAARIETGTVFDVIGTAEYVSPEQVLGKLVSFRSDLYALGCMLFEMLSGAQPFSGDDPKAILEAHKSAPPPALTISVPPEVSNLLSSLLAKEPRSRPFSAQQVRRALEPLLPTHSAPRRSSLPPVPSEQPMRTVQGMSSPMAGKKPSADEDDIDELSADEIEAIEPTVVSAAPTHGEDADGEEALDPDDLVEEGEPTSNSTQQMSAADLAAMVVESPDSAPPAALAGADVAGSDGASADAAADVDSTEERTQRPAVKFDVETLFDEDDEPPVPSDSDVTKVFRPIPEDPALAAKAAKAALASESADPDRTVVVANPFSKSGPDKRMLAVGVALLLLLMVIWGVFSGGDEPEEVAAATQHEEEDSAGDGQGAPTHAAEPLSAQQANPKAASPERVNAEPSAADQPPTEAEEPAQAQATQDEAEPAAEPEAENAGADRPAQPSVAANVEANGESARKPKETANPEPPRAATADRRAAPRPQAAPPAASGATVDELRQKAREEFQARRYRDAARYYQQAAQKAPSDPGTYAGLGASLLAAGDAQAAISAYQRAIQLSPRQSGFHAALGRAYFQLGDKGRATASYRKALELDPNNGVARAALARLES